MDPNPDRNPSDSALLQAIQRGSREAADELCLKHDPELRAVVVAFLRGHGCKYPNDHVDPVKSETWLNILRAVHQLKDVRKFKAWRDETARNEARKHLKTCIAEQITSVELKDETFLPEAQVIDYYRSRDASIDADRILALAESISPPEFAELFRLRNLENKSFDEIAELQGVTKAKLRNVYYRGLKRLRAMVRSRGG